MTTLVPARVGCRAVQNAVHGKGQQRPHREPQVHPEAAEQHEQADPQGRVADGRTVATVHQLLHPLARHLGAIPLSLRQTRLDCAAGFLADQ
jgi:hypothetical protein